jgi:hypothetical protein
MSQKTAERYAVDRSKLQTPIMLVGPSNQQVHATELCNIAYAYVVDTLEECYETPGDERW